MKRYSPLVLLMFFVVGCSSSPSCDTSEPITQWHNCSGTEVDTGLGTYIGEFKHGVRHGKGEYELYNGDKYIGEFKFNTRHGQGTYTYANGDKYVGEFKIFSNGQGTLTFANGEKIIGEWKDGKAYGQMTGIYADGGIHVNEFKDNKPHGFGFEFCFSGEQKGLQYQG